MSAPVLFIIGPTASGKTRLAIRLALLLNGEIVSADSMQVYRGMDIGTAKPSGKERGKVRHHMIDIVSPSRNFSVYDFRKKTLAILRQIVARQKLPIVCGGSGLYVRALIEGLSGQPGANAEIRTRLRAEGRMKGLETLYQRLYAVDRIYAQKITPADEKRIIRGLEIYELSGKPPSAWYVKSEPIESLGYRRIVIGISKSRQDLCRDIDARVDRMFDLGLVCEVRRLARKRLSKTARQAVGYKEILEALKMRLKHRDPRWAIVRQLIMQNTRRLAKRQMTWFKRERNVIWISWDKGLQDSDMTQKILEIVRSSIEEISPG